MGVTLFPYFFVYLQEMDWRNINIYDNIYSCCIKCEFRKEEYNGQS